MNLLWVPPSRYDSFKRAVIAMRRPYEVHSTGSSEYIKNRTFGFITSTHYLGTAILSHLRCCKYEILKNAKDKNLLIPESVKWFSLGNFIEAGAELPPRKMFVSEFDLTAAYWTVAYQLGFVSKATFEKFLRFKTKHFRLIALGMLAKREYVSRFDEAGRLTGPIEVKVDEIGTAIFHRVAYEVAAEMQRLSEQAPDDFKFYWFDNIIFSSGIRKLETEYAYRQKDETMQLLFVPRRKVILKLGAREFSFPTYTAFSEPFKEQTREYEPYDPIAQAAF